MSYCHQTNGIIDAGPKLLPESWRDAEGRPISDFDKGLGWGTPDAVNQAHFRSYGWLPVRYVNEDHDSATQVRTGPTGCNVGDAVAPDAEEVVGTYTVRDKTQTELDGEHEARRVAADNFYNSPHISALIDSIEDNVPTARGKLRADARAKIP